MKERFNQSRSLFSGDRVPETVFGYPVAADESQYTEADLAFFREHPEAAGYYQTDADGGAEETKGAVLSAPSEPPVHKGEFAGGAGYGLSFSTSFETAPVRVEKDGKVYYKPTTDGGGKYDIGGYRAYWSDRSGALVEHKNDGLLPERAYTEGKKKTDAYLDGVAKKVYAKYGVNVDGTGLDTVSRDIVFNTGGSAFLNRSPTMKRIFDSLKSRGMASNDAFGVALALEQDSYGWQNDRRFAARGGLVMDYLAGSKDPNVTKFVDAYRSGWKSHEGPSKNGNAFGTNWEKHEAGMREVTKIADAMGLKYSARGDK